MASFQVENPHAGLQVAVIEHDASGDDLVTWCYPTMAPAIQVWNDLILQITTC